jgi:CubicO group peptidase (beta-lactamase class C family)
MNKRISLLFFTLGFLLLLIGCGPSAAELEAVDYTPLSRNDWDVSTPEAEGLDPLLVAELYYDASELETIYSVLVVKNGRLIAEGYFNEGSVAQKALVQSAAKSVTSALVGIALDQGCLSSPEQKMFAFFPEYADQVTDPRKHDITIQDMLQMRAGFPPEESDQALWEAVWSGDYDHLVIDFPLTDDPGTSFQYSNLTAHWLGIIVARSCDTGLESFGQEHLFNPLGAELGSWRKDLDGYNWGAGELHLTARDAAKFGLLYLQDGEFAGNQIISADWVHDSLQTYSENAYGNISGFKEIGYGYQWWSANVGDYPVNFAWGHGGQLIVLVDELEMVVVVTGDPFYEVYGSQSWKHEKANFKLVADFIASLPAE